MRRVKEYILAGDAFQVVLSQRFEVAARRRRPVRRLSRAARDQPVAVHVPPRVPRGAGDRRLARDAGAPRGRPRRGAADRRHAAARRHARGGRRAGGRAARRSEGARRARDADRSRPQRRRPRVAASASVQRRPSSMVDRALLARHAPVVARARASWPPGTDAVDVAARRVPGRDAVAARRRSAPWRSSTSSSRTGAASTAARSATCRYTRQHRPRDRDPHAGRRTGDTIYVQAGAGHRRRLGPRADEYEETREQGARGAARGRDGAPRGDAAREGR